MTEQGRCVGKGCKEGGNIGKRVIVLRWVELGEGGKEDTGEESR